MVTSASFNIGSVDLDKKHRRVRGLVMVSLFAFTKMIF